MSNVGMDGWMDVVSKYVCMYIEFMHCIYIYNMIMRHIVYVFS